MAIPLYALVVLAGAIYFIVQSVAYRLKYKLPPQVPGWPILGNTLQMPHPAGMWCVAHAKKYGEMFTLKIGARKMVFLNSTRVVTDLLEKRASIYAGRPWRPVTQDIASGGARMLLMSHTDRWRVHRKILHAILNGQQAEKKFAPYQELEARQLVREYLDRPEDWHLANQRFSQSVMLSVIFGRRAAKGDPQFNKMLNIMLEVGALLFEPSWRNIADSLNFLTYLPKPLQWWRPYSEDLHKRNLSIYQKEVDILAEKIDNGTHKECFAKDLVEGVAKKEYDLTTTEKLMTFSTLLEAGSDTSRITVTVLLAAAAAHPEWTATARKHLDEVLGPAQRLPTLADREALPYITAVVKEALRWRPFIQIGEPHMLTQDDTYEGYTLPAGTLVTWNAYALALNENDYKEADKFVPERFLDKDLNAPLKGHWAFGTGRRVCVGYNVGFQNVWMVAASLLYCFNIEQDENDPVDTYNSRWETVDKVPFKLKITPRSQAHVDLIHRVSEGIMDVEG